MNATQYCYTIYFNEFTVLLTSTTNQPTVPLTCHRPHQGHVEAAIDFRQHFWVWQWRIQDFSIGGGGGGGGGLLMNINDIIACCQYRYRFLNSNNFGGGGGLVHGLGR